MALDDIEEVKRHPVFVNALPLPWQPHASAVSMHKEPRERSVFKAGFRGSGGVDVCVRMGHASFLGRMDFLTHACQR